MDGLVGYLHFFAYFLIVGSVLNTEKLWTRFFQTTLGASVLIAFYSFAQLAGFAVINQGGVRIDATLGNASYLGLYALFHVFIALFLFAKENTHTYLRYVYGGLAILNFVVLINTATRGVVVGFLGGILLATALVILFERKHTLLRTWAIGFMIAVVLLTGLLVALRDTTLIKGNVSIERIISLSRIENVIEEQQHSRFRIWEMGWRGFKEHPILGWGQGNFNLVFSKYYDARMYGQEPWFDRAHNVVFDRLVDGGALGFLSYLSIFFATLFLLWRGRRGEEHTFTLTECALFTGLLAAYFFQNLFIFDQFASYFLFFSVLAFLHFRATNGGERDGERERESFNQKDYIAAALILVATLTLLYTVSVSGIRANKTLLQALKPQEEGGGKNLEYFKKALAYNHTVGIMETREQLAQAAVSAARSELPIEIKQEVFTLAKNEMEQQIEDVPSDARYRMFVGNLLMNYGLQDEAIFHLQEAIKISPEKQHIYYPLGYAYMFKGDVENALNAFRTAFELEPNNETARNLYAAFAIRIGRNDVVEELFSSPEYRESLLDNPSDIVSAYFESGRFEEAAAILEEITKRRPDDAQAHLSLSGVYVEMGRIEAAIAQIEKAIELSPDFRERGEYFINEIKNGRKP